MELDDLALVHRCKEGDQRAFKVLVERYQRKVYAVANGMVKDREEALDITQEAFIKVHRSLDRFKGDSSFYTWLYRITRNLAIDRLRSRKNESVGFDEAVGNEEPPEPGFLTTQVGASPQKSALRRELADKLNAALAQIPVKHREILLLREVDGLSYEELAESLGIPKGTVMSRLYHARSKMQTILREYLGEDDLALASGDGES